MHSAHECLLKKFSLMYLHAISQTLERMRLSANKESSLLALPNEKFPSMVPPEIFIWVLTELIETRHLNFINDYLHCYLKNDDVTNCELQHAIIIFITAYKHKKMILEGKELGLFDEMKRYQAIINDNNDIYKVKNSASELSLLHAVVDIVKNIKEHSYLTIDNHRLTANVNQIFYLIIHSAIEAHEFKSDLNQKTVALLERLAVLNKRLFKDNEQKLLEESISLIKSFRLDKITLNELYSKLQPLHQQALALPHDNLFYQSLSLFGVRTQTAFAINTIFSSVCQANQEIDKVHTSLQKFYFPSKLFNQEPHCRLKQSR